VIPVPLDLPLRPSEAAELANLIFDHAERKPLTDDVRNRLAARAAALKLESIRPYFGSLGRDPVHPSAYYLAVDTAGGPAQLLYLALSTAPTSSIFHQPLLICRVRRADGPECVINATPFDAADRRNIELFATRIDGAFLPRPQGPRTEIVLPADCAGAFDAFWTIQKRSGKNMAALTGDYHACLWAAIRAGWRLGYCAVADLPAGSGSDEIRPAVSHSRFSVDVSAFEGFEPAWRAAGQFHEQVRQVRAALKISGSFEFEVRLPETSAADLESCLEGLKTIGHAAQFAAPARITGGLADAAAGVRRQQAALSFRYRGEGAAAIQEAARATLGRVSFRAQTNQEALFLAENLIA